MLQLCSKGCEYTIRALVQMLPENGDQNFAVKDVCRRADIPEPFTRKVFQSLVQGRFLQAVTGPGGGYALSRPARKINVLDVIKAVDGKDAFNRCILGLSSCHPKHMCLLHKPWARARQRLLTDLKHITLQKLIQETASKIIKKKKQRKKHK